jgi:tetratricopeptide (TPR) repeat protein
MFISVDENKQSFLDELEANPIDMDKDPFFGEPKKREPNNKISLWLAGAIVLFLISIFVIGTLLIRDLYYEPQQTNAAIENELIKFKNAINENPDDIDARIGLASIYLETNQHQKALSELNEAREIDPQSWNALFGLGLAYEAIGDHKNAKACYRQVSSMTPGSELPYYKLGTVYQDEKLYAAAISEYKKALRVNPTLSDAHYNLGFCYEKTDKPGLAVHEYRQTVKYVENHPEAEKALERLQQ